MREPHNVANSSPLLRLHFDCFAGVSMRVGFVPIDRSNRLETGIHETVDRFASASLPAATE